MDVNCDSRGRHPTKIYFMHDKNDEKGYGIMYFRTGVSAAEAVAIYNNSKIDDDHVLNVRFTRKRP